MERVYCLNSNIILLANTLLQREGGGEGPSNVYFWCDEAECGKKLPFLDCSAKGRGAILLTTFRGFLNIMVLKFVALWIQP